MNVKNATRVARSLATRSRSLDDLANGYYGTRSRWGRYSDGVDLDPAVQAEIQAMSEKQERIRKALENATVVIDL